MNYKGDIKDFPQEIVEKMLEKQVQQGNKKNVEVFEIDKISQKYVGGFTWRNTEEGFEFWENVILFEKFDLFFEKYPKKTFNRGEKILVWDLDSEEPKERIGLVYVEGAIYPVFTVNCEDEEKFKNNEPFNVVRYTFWKPLPKEEVEEYTLE